MNFMKTGWRARIGLIFPASCIVMEPEFYKMVPPGVSVHAARMYIETSDIEGIMQMEKELEGAAERIKSVDPDIIAYCCTMGSFYKGMEGNRNLIQKIQNIARAPTITTSEAVIEALNVLELKKIFIITPYIEEINKVEKNFFEECGLDVIGIKGMNLLKPKDYLHLHPYDIYRFTMKSFEREADGLFISCTNSATLEIIEFLEKDLGKPVVAADQATIWKTLKELNLYEPREGYGQLFRVLS